MGMVNNVGTVVGIGLVGGVVGAGIGGFGAKKEFDSVPVGDREAKKGTEDFNNWRLHDVQRVHADTTWQSKKLIAGGAAAIGAVSLFSGLTSTGSIGKLAMLGVGIAGLGGGAGYAALMLTDSKVADHLVTKNYPGAWELGVDENPSAD